MAIRLPVVVAFAFHLFVTTNGVAAEMEFSADQLEFFEKQVRPLLVERCFECHSGEEYEASLRLDSRAAALKGGDTGPAVVPGDVTQGQLLSAIAYDPDSYQMPPDGKLSDGEIAVLKKWVEMGAPWPGEETSATETMTKAFNLDERAEHWSFQPLMHEGLPEVDHPQWCRSPIDRFVLRKLEQASLPPGEEADRQTWIRRAYFDVIGLPPSPEEVRAFVHDQRPDAYERVVNRLLSSPHYGERWGRHWLDLVRYAESRGHEFDFNVANAWQYRDYVIRALNADVPYDQFVVEHVAGDLLPLPETSQSESAPYLARLAPHSEKLESILGTGFWFLGEWVHSPVDIRQEEADRFDNMIDVYSKTFLGLTVACARCHDHKFDPIRAADFYALQGVLQSSIYRHAPFETLATQRQLAAKFRESESELTEAYLDSLRVQAGPVLAQLDQYLIATSELIGDGITLSPEVQIFADFESGTYDGWTIDGNAFGEVPQTLETIAEYQGKINGVGTYFVNSHQKRNGGPGDAATGKLTSREFVIEHATIRMLVGGGAHAGQTCLNLIVNGEAVLSATGQNNNQMFPVEWDVRPWHGQTAVIEIVDNATGGWGNIGVDQITFHHLDTALTLEDEKRVIEAAKGRGLNPEVLAAWVTAMARAADNPKSLWSAWAQLCQKPNQPTAEIVSVVGSDRESSGSSAPETSAFETYLDAESFLTDSAAFQLRRPGIHLDLSDNSDQPIQGLTQVTRSEWVHLPAFHADKHPLSEPEPGNMESWQQGALLATPSFEIQSGRIWCLIRGGGNTYVAVDSHHLIRGPLHGSLTRQHGPEPGWRWIEHRVNGYEGHRAHVEFFPRPGEPLEVAAVVQSETAPDLMSFVPTQDLMPLLPGPVKDEVSVKAWSREIAKQLRAAVSKENSDQQTVAWLDWIIKNPALFLPQETTSVVAKLPERFQNLVERLTTRQASPSQIAPCMLDGSSEEEYIFIRGSWKKRGETVPRRFLEVFGGEPIDSPGSGRLQLAGQMVDPEQTPIVPRVIVNRIWQHYFGRGIVPTPDDFGHLGQPPSHPELLDWLARDLVEHDWSLKHIHRRILLSSAYRMSSEEDGGSAQDPGNVLLHRMAVKRMEGETVRDAILAVSGRLNPEFAGPSVPIHLTSFLEGRGRPGQSGPVDGQGRRSLYLSVRRNFPDPFLQAFDFPNPHSTTGRRNVSNVPAQALAMMNNPLVTEQSRFWAERLLRKTPGGAIDQRVETLFLEAYSRAPTPAEQTFAEQFLIEQARAYDTTLSDVQVWSDYCHVLMNLKEFVFVR
ncbi:MAG: PSD1 domain-containing protein [Planctomycetaceae bacterium]|nr:PSD1 domain-containing protein [Planctomycetaceae bacterium]